MSIKKQKKLIQPFYNVTIQMLHQYTISWQKLSV